MIRTCNIRAVQTDGIQVWAGAVTGVPESNYVGIIGAANGYARISDFAVWAL